MAGVKRIIAAVADAGVVGDKIAFSGIEAADKQRVVSRRIGRQRASEQANVAVCLVAGGDTGKALCVSKPRAWKGRIREPRTRRKKKRRVTARCGVLGVSSSSLSDSVRFD